MIANNFKQPSDGFFEFNCIPLASLGLIKLGEFKACLLAQQSLLYAKQITQLLDSAIVSRSLLQKKRQLMQKCIDSNMTWQIDKFEQRANAVGAAAYKGADNRRLGPNIQRLGSLESIDHLHDITKMSSGMIFAQLAEKYRSAAARRVSSTDSYVSTDGHRFFPYAAPKQYVSPYNLDERAKRLDDPARPDLPCICDPECICAPLCAGEPYRNCLCEENGLFARVTEGMDIDDLDVPDLKRRKRQSSNGSNASMNSPHQQIEPSAFDPLVRGTVLDPLFDERTVAQEITSQGHELRAQVNDNLDLDDFTSYNKTQLDDSLCSADTDDHSVCGTSLYYDLRIYALSEKASDALREALARPFTEQCNTPPKRPNIRTGLTERLFRGPGDTKLGARRMSVSAGLMRGASANGAAQQGRKRSLADVSLPSLKRTFHYSPRARKTRSPDLGV